MGVFVFLTLSVFAVEGVFGSNLVSVMEGDSVTLQSDVTKQGRDKMLWYFNDTLIALINGDPSKSCVYHGEGEIFKGRLEVDFETGSLTIRNLIPEHTGRYEANFIRSKSSGTTQSLNRNGKCDSTKITKKMVNIGDTVKTFSISVSASLSGPYKSNEESYNVEKEKECEKNSVLSLGVTAGICAGVGFVLLVAAAVVGVIYCRYKSSKKEDMEKNKFEKLLNVPPSTPIPPLCTLTLVKVIGIYFVLTLIVFLVAARLFGSDKISKESYIMGNVRECENVLSVNYIAGICAGVSVVLLLAAAVVCVIYCCCRSSNKEDMKKDKSKQLLKVPVREGHMI
ncbi:hypothetical protein Q8A67_005663 [Cirrhinus molitorella]|uniref:Immunoglobulin subtype domain-containing protein n=1 Tax=Cirrhinus molitorella TaxID=172907 RepID=A0AA88Q6H0_9TELE|nr:hypothetical protein Q8A67_005663 [Cirrhinus molitorella]